MHQEVAHDKGQNRGKEQHSHVQVEVNVVIVGGVVWFRGLHSSRTGIQAHSEHRHHRSSGGRFTANISAVRFLSCGLFFFAA